MAPSIPKCHCVGCGLPTEDVAYKYGVSCKPCYSAGKTEYIDALALKLELLPVKNAAFPYKIWKEHIFIGVTNDY